jgi:hypothetical protein
VSAEQPRFRGGDLGVIELAAGRQIGQLRSPVATESSTGAVTLASGDF